MDSSSKSLISNNMIRGSESTLGTTRTLEGVSFTESEIQKIMADEKLIGIAKSNPKRAKRVLANRQSARRSKERKLAYMSELEQNVKKLELEEAALAAELRLLEHDNHKLTNYISDAKLHIQAMEQHVQHQCVMQDALNRRLQQLRDANQ